MHLLKHYMTKYKWNGLFFIFIITISFKTSVDPEDIKINQLQIIASHNSYRIKTDTLYNYCSSSKHPLLKWFLQNPWDYSHPTPIHEQFSEYGLRGLEIDIYRDPQGGLFYNRKGNKLVNMNVESGIESLKKPGLKVMHVPDFDYTSQCITFIDALTTIKNWSDANPNHSPLFIMIEAKERNLMKYFKKRYATSVLKFTKGSLDSVDLEIEQVFGENSDKIFTPDKLRGNYNTLNEAVLANSWPKLSEARGKIFFIFYAASETKNLYLEDHYSLKNRYMFVYSTPGNPEAAFVKRDDPVSDFDEIQKFIKQGYMVRTRADANTKEARSGNYFRFNKAMQSGANIIATDYYKPDERYKLSQKWSNYQVQFPDKNVIKVNPVNGAGDIKFIKN